MLLVLTVLCIPTKKTSVSRIKLGILSENTKKKYNRILKWKTVSDSQFTKEVSTTTLTLMKPQPQPVDKYVAIW